MVSFRRNTCASPVSSELPGLAHTFYRPSEWCSLGGMRAGAAPDAAAACRLCRQRRRHPTYPHALSLLQAGPKKTYSVMEWVPKLSAVQINKQDLNRLVMNFLVTEVGAPFGPCFRLPPRSRHPRELPCPYPPPQLLPQGYVDAARVFERESGTAPGVDLDKITDRMEIRKALQGGDVVQVGGWEGRRVVCIN